MVHKLYIFFPRIPTRETRQQWRIQGGSAPGAVSYMQFFGKFGKIICWHPPGGLAALSYGESWIRPWTVVNPVFLPYAIWQVVQDLVDFKVQK